MIWNYGQLQYFQRYATISDFFVPQKDLIPQDYRVITVSMTSSFTPFLI